MRVSINEPLKKFLEQKGYKDLVLQVKLCRSWGGSYKDLTASFAEGNEPWLEEDGYVAGETEIGKIFYRPQEVSFGENPEVLLISFFMGKRIAFKDIKAVI